MSNRKAIIEELNQAVQRAGNRTVIFTHVIANSVGLSATEFECLDFIQDQGAVPAGRLAELTGLTTGAVTGLIDRLEKAGFLKRMPDPKDRRRVLVEAVHNEAATIKVRKLYEPVSQGFAQLTQRYSDTELTLITRYMNDSIMMIDDITNGMTKRNSGKN